MNVDLKVVTDLKLIAIATKSRRLDLHSKAGIFISAALCENFLNSLTVDSHRVHRDFRRYVLCDLCGSV